MKKIAIIGAGIFGTSIAVELSKNEFQVDLYETEPDIMLKASKNNHNRIHYGYHYPRSIETANQSLEGLISFYGKYKDSIINSFPNYYCIFGLSSFRLLPSFSRILNALQSIAYSKSSFLILEENLLKDNYKIKKDASKLILKKSIELKNVSFKYNDNQKLVLSNISFNIPVAYL